MALTIEVPDRLADVAGLDRIDYDEAFSVDVSWSGSPEQWARHELEGAPPPMRAFMLNGWRALRIPLAPLDSPGAVLGWTIRERTPEHIVLGVQSRLGLTARIVLLLQPGRVVHSMAVRYDTTVGRLTWAVVAPPHRAFVRRLLDVAAQGVT